MLAVSAVAISVLCLVQSGSFRVAPSPFEIAVPLKSVQGLSLERGLPPATVLKEFVASGVTAAILEERTLSDLALLGGFSVVQGPETDRLTTRFPSLAAWRGSAPGVPATLLITRDSALADWALGRSTARFGRDRVAFFREPEGPAAGPAAVVAIRGNLPSYTRLGFYPPDIDLVRSLGLRLVVEMHNPRDQPGFRLATALEPLGPALPDVTAALFAGVEVWGNGSPGGPAAAGRDLAARGVPFAFDPDKNPAGAGELGQAAGWHGVGVQEIWTPWRPELYAEGIVERQAPLLVVMPGFFSAYATDPSWPADATKALAGFRAQIAARGLVPGRPRSEPVVRSPLAWTVLAGWGVLAAALLALVDVLALAGRKRAGASARPEAGTRPEVGTQPSAATRPATATLVAALLTAAAAAGLPWLLASGARIATLQGLGLLAALVFPVHALLPLVSHWAAKSAGLPGGGDKHEHRNRDTWVWPAIREAVRIAVLSLAGGLVIRALGAGPETALKVVVFRGTKVALVAGPVAGVVLFWLASTAWRSRWDQLKQWVLGLLRVRLNLGLVVAAVALAAVALYYVSRSGSNPVAPVSDLEFRVRGYLMEIFVVRPRTKEFLVGYPAIIVGVWLAATGRLRRPNVAWGYVAAGVAGVTPSSVLNTFSHFHIPAIISLERTASGLGLGVAVGLAAAALLSALARYAARGRDGPATYRSPVAPVAIALVVLASALLAALGPGLAAGNPAQRPVEITVDLADLEAPTGDNGPGQAWDIAALREAGVTSVAVGETAVSDLAARGLLRVLAGQDLQTRALTGEASPDERAVAGAPGFDPTQTYVFLPPGAAGAQATPATAGGASTGSLGPGEIARRFLASTGDRSAVFARLPSALVIRCAYPRYVVEATGLGFPPGLVRTRLERLSGTGLWVVPRPGNVPGGRAEALDAKLGEIRTVLDSLDMPWSTVIFQGAEVAGYPGVIPGAAAVLGRRGLITGLILAPDRPGYLGQLGTFSLAHSLGYRYARVLTLDTATPAPTAAQRVASRDAEVIYVRLKGTGSDRAGDPDEVVTWLRQLSTELASRSRTPGRATANSVTYQAPGSLGATPWLGLVLVLGIVLAPVAGATLPGTLSGRPVRMAVTGLLASLLGGLLLRALLSDARVVLELRPAHVLATLAVGAGLVAALAQDLSRWTSGPNGPAWWDVPLSPALVVLLAGLVGGAYWLEARAVGNGLAAVAFGAAVAGSGLGGPGTPPNGRLAVAGAAYGGSAFALIVASSAGRALSPAVAWPVAWAALGWVAGWAAGVAAKTLLRRLRRS